MWQWHVECGQSRCEEMLRDEGMFPEERGYGAQSGDDNFADGGAEPDVSGDEIIGAEMDAGEEQVAVL